MGKGLLVLFLGLSSFAVAKDFDHKLPAGGKAIITTEWDRHTVWCTSEPQEPKILTQTCTCTSRYIYSAYYYVLIQSSLLSTGKTVALDLADRLQTLDECTRLKRGEYASVCK